MGRGLDGLISRFLERLCSFEGPDGLAKFPVAIAWGKHLFPFRTEQLSPTAPMVLGSQGPGRVGRRRFFDHEPPLGAARRRCGSGLKGTRTAPRGAAREAMKSGVPGRTPGRSALPSSQTGRRRRIRPAVPPGGTPACGRPARVGGRCRSAARVADG